MCKFGVVQLTVGLAIAAEGHTTLAIVVSRDPITGADIWEGGLHKCKPAFSLLGLNGGELLHLDQRTLGDQSPL